MINLKIYSYLCKLSYVIASAYQNGDFLKIPCKSIIFTPKTRCFFSQAVPIIILEKRLGGAACVI